MNNRSLDWLFTGSRLKSIGLLGLLDLVDLQGDRLVLGGSYLGLPITEQVPWHLSPKKADDS